MDYNLAIVDSNPFSFYHGKGIYVIVMLLLLLLMMISDVATMFVPVVMKYAFISKRVFVNCCKECIVSSCT